MSSLVASAPHHRRGRGVAGGVGATTGGPPRERRGDGHTRASVSRGRCEATISTRRMVVERPYRCRARWETVCWCRVPTRVGGCRRQTWSTRAGAGGLLPGLGRVLFQWGGGRGRLTDPSKWVARSSILGIGPRSDRRCFGDGLPPSGVERKGGSSTRGPSSATTV